LIQHVLLTLAEFSLADVHLLLAKALLLGELRLLGVGLLGLSGLLCAHALEGEVVLRPVGTHQRGDIGTYSLDTLENLSDEIRDWHFEDR
jgi:hypothetical protein